MEPKQPTSYSGFEQPPAQYGQNLEQSTSFPSPERAIEQGNEQFEQRSEATLVAATPLILPTPVIVPSPSPVVVDDTALVGSGPIAAADEDLIEKEWVDQAKKIILRTKDDPYRREQEVSKLQADYLRKRYGKELGVSL